MVEEVSMAVRLVDHPLVRHKLGLLRRESTGTGEFRGIADVPARTTRATAFSGRSSVRKSA